MVNKKEGLTISSVIKIFGSQNFLLGLGVAAVASLMGPTLKESLKSVAVKGTQGVMVMGSKAKEMFSESKENSAGNTSGNATTAESVLNEKFIKELKEEREMTNKIMEELKNSIVSLKEEFSLMKNGQVTQEV